MWIERDLEPALLTAAAQRPALVLTGARQCGKTSLLQRLFPKHGFVSLDLPSEAAQAESDTSLFLSRHPGPLVIDEVQYAPKLFRHLKRVIDLAREQNGRFILTGSQKFSLMQEVSDSLAGRADIFELLPLSLREVRRSSEHASVDELIVRGGYPELHANLALDATRFYSAYTTTYLERDVRQILNVGDLRDFERFLRAAALRSAQLVNRAELARDVGVSPNTANAWLSVLSASNIVAQHEPWFAKSLKSIVKTPKLYLLDTGLLSFLVNITSSQAFLTSPLAGALFETFVFAELKKALDLTAQASSLYFFRDQKREVDFLIHRGGRYLLFDAKLSETPSERDASALLHVASQLGHENVLAMGLVCRTPASYRLPNGVDVLTVEDAVRRLAL